jgi:hypothetical protein
MDTIYANGKLQEEGGVQSENRIYTKGAKIAKGELGELC